jgi:hypothetical protein
LVAEVDKIGGKPDEGTRIDGKIYRTWMDFKSMVTGKDRKAILGSCEKGEDVALNAYEKALKDKDLPSSLSSLITDQYNKIKTNHNEVRKMRDTAVTAKKRRESSRPFCFYRFIQLIFNFLYKLINRIYVQNSPIYAARRRRPFGYQPYNYAMQRQDILIPRSSISIHR